MKKHSNKLSAAAALVCLLVAGTALAASYSTPTAILSIEVGDQSTTCNGSSVCIGNGTQTVVTFKTTPTGANPVRPSCGNGSPASVVLASPNGQVDHIKSLASVASAAFLAGKPVKIFYEGGCSADGVARAKALVIQ